MALWIGACTWLEFPNTEVAGGVPLADATLAQCQRQCIDTIYCIGVDVTMSPSSRDCRLHILPESTGTLRQANGFAHHRLTRNLGCPYMGKFACAFGRAA